MAEQRELEQELTALRARLGASQELHRRAEAMLASVQHRVRNLLASVRSLASHTLDSAGDITQFIEQFDGRLAALARCQSILMRGGDDRVDLEELLREEFLSHAIDQNERITMQGDSVQLAPRTAEAIALALHELTTNAIKYGALASDDGELAVSWNKFNNSVAIDWAETGAPSPIEAQREGFGRGLIERGLPFQLGASTLFEFTPTGIHCRITAKVDDSMLGHPA